MAETTNGMRTAGGDAGTTALVHEGWSHLQSQRPLAAWGSWQRALKIDPNSAAAKQALTTLESASDLPLAARAAYRFRQPVDPERRAVWNTVMRDQAAQDLAAAADVFGQLAADDPMDAAAWYNRALGLAWLGHNREAVDCLDRVVELEAESDFDQAVDAWALAEVLRHGAGAEALADDLRFAFTVTWEPDDLAWLLDEFPEIQRVSVPQLPGAPEHEGGAIEVFEWLDRPIAGMSELELARTPLPRALASVYAGRQTLRVSSPRRDALERVEELLLPRLEDGSRSIRREATPLPLPFLDAAVWTFRVSAGVDSDLADSLRRDSIEQYFENEWIHGPRHGLHGRTPLEIARDGSAAARARLMGVVKLREQLGSRAAAASLYQGYPFDRLRRRLGLELAFPSSVDREELGSASPVELDRLDLAALDDARLVEAVASAAGLRDDARTGRFAAELVERQPAAIGTLDLTAAIAPLVRRAMAAGAPDEALGWIERAKPMARARQAFDFDVWSAEILARSGQARAALAIYQTLIGVEGRPDVVLDAIETMLDNDHGDEAKELVDIARETARRTGRRWLQRRVQELRARLA